MRVEATDAFRKWQDKLRDRKAVQKIAITIARLARGLGDVASVGGGVIEARIHYGPGYRLYFTRRGDKLIVLLCGGDKSTQAKDIAFAKEMGAQLE